MKQLPVCRLCLKSEQLLKSHIIPSFILRWLKASGLPLRSSQTPNRRIQDGPKLAMLCGDCEQLLSSWEKSFAEEIFIPFHERRADLLTYKNWALKFAVSVSWRVMQYFESIGDNDHLTEEQQGESRIACRFWKEFMQGTRPHPGKYEQHILAVDALEGVSGGAWSPFLNRYLLRTADIDIVAWDHCAMVYTKMGRIILFGFLTDQDSRHWKGTRLHVREGRIGSKGCRVPLFALTQINDMAEISANALARLSTKQNKKLQKEVLRNADSVVESEMARALRRDIRLFGRQAAFRVTEAGKSE